MEPHLNNQERRRNKIPMWSWIAGSVLLAIVLGWGFVELAGQLQGDRTLSLYHRTNQESAKVSRLDRVRLYQKQMPTRMPAKSIRARPHLSYLMSSARR